MPMRSFRFRAAAHLAMARTKGIPSAGPLADPPAGPPRRRRPPSPAGLSPLPARVSPSLEIALGRPSGSCLGAGTTPVTAPGAR